MAHSRGIPELLTALFPPFSTACATGGILRGFYGNTQQ